MAGSHEVRGSSPLGSTDESEHPLLTIDQVVAAIFVAIRDHAADEVTASSAFLMRVEEIVEELLNLPLLPDVRALELWDCVVLLEHIIQREGSRLLDHLTVNHSFLLALSSLGTASVPCHA
jgi:hypothetical protein